MRWNINKRAGIEQTKQKFAVSPSKYKAERLYVLKVSL